MPDPRGHCRKCGAPIIWAVTEAGKAIPIDADPARTGKALRVPNGNVVFTRERDDEGRWIVRIVKAGTAVFVSHFATCPNAGEFRR